MHLGLERRAAPRVAYDSDALVVAGQQRMFCRTVNLSATGLLLLPKTRMPPGTELVVDVSLPCIENVMFSAVLAREATARGLYAWGVRFVRVPTYVRAVLRDFVRQRLRGIAGSRAIFPAGSHARAALLGASTAEELVGASTAEELVRVSAEELVRVSAEELVAVSTAEQLPGRAAEAGVGGRDERGVYVKVFRRPADSSIADRPQRRDRVGGDARRGGAASESPRVSTTRPARTREVRAAEREWLARPDTPLEVRELYELALAEIDESEREAKKGTK